MVLVVKNAMLSQVGHILIHVPLQNVMHVKVNVF
jgi:hypothetical protein